MQIQAIRTVIPAKQFIYSLLMFGMSLVMRAGENTTGRPEEGRLLHSGYLRIINRSPESVLVRLSAGVLYLDADGSGRRLAEQTVREYPVEPGLFQIVLGSRPE